MNVVRYYNRNAAKLCDQYDSIEAGDVHNNWAVGHLPQNPGFACDIGAGSGRDANWLASQGWDVVAVEPGSEMRKLAMVRSHPNVTWLDDALPHLHKLRALGHRFDLVLLSAVWMHLPPSVRERAFRIISELLKPAGVLVITLRYGRDEAENTESGISLTCNADELLEYARRRAVAFSDRFREPDERVITSPGRPWFSPCPMTVPAACRCCGTLSSTITSLRLTSWACCVC